MILTNRGNACMRSILILFLLGCSSVQSNLSKLDLSAEKQMILDSADIPEPKKKFIVNTFDKAESFCNDAVSLVNSLHEVIEKQKTKIAELDEQAGIYRFWRNALILLCVLFVLYELRGFILPIVRKLMGIPI